MMLLVAFAFLAGVVTILSPCILPLLPIILSATTGNKRPVGVIVGFIASFTFFTLFLSSIVRISGIPASTLRTISVIIIAGFGISLVIPKIQLLIEQLFVKLTRFAPKRQAGGFSGGLAVGFSLGLLWTPCVGPILASVISLAISEAITWQAALITLAYATGTAIPMFLIMLGGTKALQRVPWLTRNTANIQRVFGVIMLLTAIGIYLGIDRAFQSYILSTFPQYSSNLTQIEDNKLIWRQLDRMR